MENPPPPQSKNTQMTSAITQFPDDPVASSLFDWSDFLEFSLDDQLNISFDSDHQLQSPNLPSPQASNGEAAADPGRVRKRDPRMVCSNFLAGRIPCACPELDEQLEKEEEELAALGPPGKKKARTGRASGGAGQSTARCQVPDCEADISELKGYHRRHRICLNCANATSVVLDGESKRYCQQCGKFHVLMDFDEGKRSCRRKLERHNNRRRRKSADPKGSAEKEPQQVSVADEGDFYEDSSKDGTGTGSQVLEREVLLESEGNLSTLCSTLGSQNIHSDGIVTFAASGEVQSEKEKENKKDTQSPSYCDNRSALSSVCPTGRISFKLYDWNPAEFPRRLRHQIFQWLASMPVELEGYIRPGCTILTVFITMPHFKWAKLLEEPAIRLRDLVLSPGNMLHGRGTFLVYLDNMVFRVTKGGTSIMKVKLKGKTPKLYYVHPTCFEAGKPMEFFVCGSNLLQSKFRFLVSFSGKYLANDFSISSCCKIQGDSSSLDHQLLKVSVPQTNADLFGPAFIEVENECGLSNFVPILIADKDICAEMDTMLERLNRSIHPRGSQFVSSCPCENSNLRGTELSDFVLDVAWLLREPVVESTQLLTSTLIQRFRRLLDLLIENESTSILGRALSHIKTVMDNSSDAGVADSELNIFRGTLDSAQAFLCQRLNARESLVGSSIKDAMTEKSFTRIYTNEMQPVIPAINQDLENTMLCKSESRLTFVDDSSTAPLLAVTSVDLKERPWKSCSPSSFGKTVLTCRPLVFAISAVAVCFGVCAVVLHPNTVGEFTTTIRRCLFDNS